MENGLAIIGIDSLDPYILLKYKKELPNFSNFMAESPTFISKSVFPVDTIPAWASIYTGLHPGNHGLLYIYDVFDPKLMDLRKLDISQIKGRTFWDYASREGYRTVILYPTLMYPSWEVNGIMISKSPFDRRLNWISTEIDINVYPELVKEKYKIPDTFIGLWGGFPGIKRLQEWAEMGKEILENEKNIGMEIYTKEKWNLFFIYFSILDIIQHRIWRFFDETDPSYRETLLNDIIIEYYKIFDGIIGEFIEAYPNITLIVMSDHGHKSRPAKTVNINEHLRRNGHLTIKNKKMMTEIRKVILEVITKLNIEHWIINLISKVQGLSLVSKSIYSSAGSIYRGRSIAYLSSFAGIKSYSHGGIEINNDLVSDTEYEKIREELINLLLKLKTSDGKPLLKWIKRREEVYLGKFNEKIFPDIVFELQDSYGVGWDIHSDLYGKAYDHNVASGGHAKDAVFLIRNVNREIMIKDITMMDVAPTILDLLDIDLRRFDFDGRSIFN